MICFLISSTVIVFMISKLFIYNLSLCYFEKEHYHANEELQVQDYLKLLLKETHIHIHIQHLCLLVNSKISWHQIILYFCFLKYSGTPIQNSIKDLWSLVNFLQISPFTDRQWWTRAIERPLEQGNESAIK